MSDLMFYGVLRMPYEMAMADEMSRIQFYSRAKEAADRVEKAEAEFAAQLPRIRHLEHERNLARAALAERAKPVTGSIDTDEFAELLWAFCHCDDVDGAVEKRADLIAYIDAQRAPADEAPELINLGSMMYQGRTVTDWVITCKGLLGKVDEAQGEVAIQCQLGGGCLCSGESGGVSESCRYWTNGLDQSEESQGAAAEVSSMPGTSGFTVAVFKAEDAPVGSKVYTHAQPTAEEATDAAMLLEVIRTVRNHPEFDDEEAPFSVMMDEALAGKRPALLDTIDSLANGRRPTVEEVTNEPFYWLEAEESARGSDPRDVFGKHSMLYSTRMSKDKPIGSNPCWPLYLHPAPKVSRTDHLQKIIAYAYQIAGAHDAPEHILDVLADPEAATDEQVEAMLPYVPQPDRSRPSGNAGEGAAGEFKALWNNCDCHPATCACDAWAVYAPNGKRHSTYGSKVAAEEMAVLLSPKSAAPAFNQSEFDTMVEKGAKAWDGVPGDFVEELRGGADKQQAAIPELESEQNQSLSSETRQSDQQQQAGVEHAKRAEPDELALFEAWRHSLGGAQDDGIAVKFVPTLPPIAWEAWKAGRAALQQQAGGDALRQAVFEAAIIAHGVKFVMGQRLDDNGPALMAVWDACNAALAAAPTLGGAK